MIVFIGTDHAGFEVKDYVKEIIVGLGHTDRINKIESCSFGECS